MAGYVHRTERERRAEQPRQALPEGLEQQAVVDAAEQLLRHAQRIKAGVPECSCGATFTAHASYQAEHALHVAEEMVPELTALLMGGLQPAAPGPRAKAPAPSRRPVPV